MKDGKEAFVASKAGRQARLSFLRINPKGETVRVWHSEVFKIYGQPIAKSLAGMVKP